MKECTTEFMDMILRELTIAPDSQISKEIKTLIVDYVTTTNSDKFDFINSITDMDVSDFIKELCNLTKYYIRPVN